ncbi:MAG: rhodanese-like domain-containing protein [Bacteroidota bacterium]|nr:rhodanese-like domain-containing protein [Bacteroidota bacterium]
MIIQQFEAKGLAHYSYLVADKEEGIAIVIDAERDVKTYIEYVAEHRLKLAFATETHIHADFASGTLELAHRVGAEVYLSAYDENEVYQYQFKHNNVREGDIIQVGKHHLQVLHTPGHTPEHISFLAFEAGNDNPIAIFSGDFLFIGSVGRPDLLGEGNKDHLAKSMYNSIQRHIPALADGLVVYPAHGAGSLCGAGLSKANSSTIGVERTSNPYLSKELSEADFISRLLTSSPYFPQYYLRMKQINSDGPNLLEGKKKPQPLSVKEFAKKVEEQEIVIDVREPLSFGGSHIYDSINIGTIDQLGFWAAWILPYDQDINLIVDDESDVRKCWQALVRVGLDQVDSYLSPNITAWANQGEDFTYLPNVSVHMLNDLMEMGEQISVLDVRTLDEFSSGHITGSKHIYLGELEKNLDEYKDKSTEIYCVCGGGMRSSIAGSILMKNGFENVTSVFGGITAWKAADFPVKTGLSLSQQKQKVS